jgi:hypothetical protein
MAKSAFKARMNAGMRRQVWLPTTSSITSIVLPRGFCDGVIDRAKEIVVLDLAEVDAIHDMDLSACFERCIDVVESLRLTHPDRSALEEFVLAARKLFAMVESQSLDIANPPSEVRVVEGQAGLSEELIFIPRAVARLISHVHRGTTEGVHKLVVDLIERAQERGVK